MKLNSGQISLALFLIEKHRVFLMDAHLLGQYTAEADAYRELYDHLPFVMPQYNTNDRDDPSIFETNDASEKLPIADYTMAIHKDLNSTLRGLRDPIITALVPHRRAFSGRVFQSIVATTLALLDPVHMNLIVHQSLSDEI